MSTPTPKNFYMYGPTDLLGLVPHLIGYQPVDAVAALAVRDGRLGTGIVVDVPPGDFTVEHAASAVGDLLAAGPAAVIVIGYETITNGSARVAGYLVDAISSVGLEVTERLVVTPTRWRHFECTCCPSEGRTLPANETYAVKAFRAATGSVPAASRAALAARIMPSSRATEVESACEALAVAGTSEATGVLSWGRILDSTTPVADLPTHVLAHAALAVQENPDIRDALVFAVCPGMSAGSTVDVPEPPMTIPMPWGEGMPTGPQITEAINRLAQACANMPDNYGAQALAALSAALWWDGQTAFARLAAERALRADPTCGLAHAVGIAVLIGVPPNRF